MQRRSRLDPSTKRRTAMSVDELLDLIDETLEEGTGLPFTGGKRMVDV